MTEKRRQEIIEAIAELKDELDLLTPRKPDDQGDYGHTSYYCDDCRHAVYDKLEMTCGKEVGKVKFRDAAGYGEANSGDFGWYRVGARHRKCQLFVDRHEELQKAEHEAAVDKWREMDDDD